MKQLTKSFAALLFLLIGFSVTFAQADPNKMNNHKNPSHQNPQMAQDTTKIKMDNPKNPIVREGVIDLVSIDKNKDGKVFQDMMCWNVISDKAGDCPLCDMKLKEVTIEKAKTNLLKNNFKVKQ